MKINVHAGHNPDGKIACGAVGLIKESTQARKVKGYVIKYLKAAGHTVYDCTCNNGTSQSDVLNRIGTKCNAHMLIWMYQFILTVEQMTETETVRIPGQKFMCMTNQVIHTKLLRIFVRRFQNWDLQTEV